MPQSHAALIALGGNLGDRAAWLRRAVRALSALGEVADTSFLYETDPVLLENQPRFLNAACRLVTQLNPRELLRGMQRIEQDLGRRKSVRYGPRNIDLDLAFYADSVLCELPFIQVPHAQAARRDFVLEPLCDMVPQFRNPQTGLTLEEELRRLRRPPLRQVLPIGDGIWPVRERPRVAAILNVSPESRLAPGRVPEDKAARSELRVRLRQLEAEGADLIDIGAQTARPGHELIPEEEEIRRLRLALDTARAVTNLPLSADTFRPRAAAVALEHGADMINDVWAGRFDPEILTLTARAGVPHVLMHSRQGVQDSRYPSNLRELKPMTVPDIAPATVRQELETRAAAGRAAGQMRWLQVTDAGLGFGKSPEVSAVLCARFPDDARWKYPVMSGPSRKGFVRHFTGAGGPVVAGSVTAALVASRGAHILRMHDIAATVGGLRLWDALGQACTLEPADGSQVE